MSTISGCVARAHSHGHAVTAVAGVLTCFTTLMTTVITAAATSPRCSRVLTHMGSQRAHRLRMRVRAVSSFGRLKWIGVSQVSLWDARTGLCIQTFYGHLNSCNHVAFNLRGDTIASSDADGGVRLWDVRMVQERLNIDAGPHAANKVALDRSGTVLAVASDDHSVKVFDANDGSILSPLDGHEEAVQAVCFDSNGNMLITSGSDNTFRVWS